MKIKSQINNAYCKIIVTKIKIKFYFQRYEIIIYLFIYLITKYQKLKYQQQKMFTFYLYFLVEYIFVYKLTKKKCNYFFF